MAIPPVILSAVMGSVLTSWFADQIPRPGEPAVVVERKVRNIVLSAITSIGVGYIITQLTKPPTTEVKLAPFTTEERLVLPGYYEGVVMA